MFAGLHLHPLLPLFQRHGRPDMAFMQSYTRPVYFVSECWLLAWLMQTSSIQWVSLLLIQDSLSMCLQHSMLYTVCLAAMLLCQWRAVCTAMLLVHHLNTTASGEHRAFRIHSCLPNCLLGIHSGYSCVMGCNTSNAVHILQELHAAYPCVQ